MEPTPTNKRRGALFLAGVMVGVALGWVTPRIPAYGMIALMFLMGWLLHHWSHVAGWVS